MPETLADTPEFLYLECVESTASIRDAIELAYRRGYGAAIEALRAAGRLLPEGGQTRTEWGTTGKVSELVIPATDEASALRVAGRFRGSHVVRRTVVDGPWVAVYQPKED